MQTHPHTSTHKLVYLLKENVVHDYHGGQVGGEATDHCQL